MFRTSETARTTVRLPQIVALVGLLALSLSLLMLPSTPAKAALEEGSHRGDVLIGRDNDNAANTFIQPAGVATKQHLDNTDVLLGREGDDLLIELLGDDVLSGSDGSDIMVGGNEAFQAPNSDILDGGSGKDINIWAPGDGSDLFRGGPNEGIMVFAPFVLKDGKPELFSFRNRQIPRVSIDNKPQFNCTIEAVPASAQLGVDYLARFFANGNLAVTVRLKDVEQVFCASPTSGTVRVANLNGSDPTTFVEQPLRDFRGQLIGAIMQAP